MHTVIRSYCLKSLLILLVFAGCTCQAQNSLLSHGFAHNDYWHRRPLYDALDKGYVHIEADIYLRKGRLIVAHLLPVFKKKKTLEQLYLKPLLEGVRGTNHRIHGDLPPITLMIDIKSDANKTYAELQPLLQKYKSILSSYENGKLIRRQVTVVITGHKPYALIKAQANRLAFIDEDLMKVEQDVAAEGIYQTASCKYSRLLSWAGIGEIPRHEKERLTSYVAAAHLYGKKVRLWGSPENELVWAELLACGVDLINTDKLEELQNFLMAQQRVFAEAGGSK
jgi:hypothetical protein